MIDPPQIVKTEARIAAVIRLVIPRSEIQNAMGPAIGEVMTAVATALWRTELNRPLIR